MKATRIISVILSLVIVCSAFTGFTVFAVETNAEGSANDVKTVGDNANTKSVSSKTSGITGDCVWKYDPTSKTLTISGNGKMYDYNEDDYFPSWCGCGVIENVVIENGVTYIGEYAFYNCINLKKVSIPSTVKEIARGALKECEGLSGIVIPDGITSVSSFAFEGCTNLKKVIFPESIKTISAYVFSGCKSLTSVTMGGSVTEIDTGAFKNCTSLSSVIIPDTLEYLGEDAFYNTAFFNKLPKGVAYIGNWAIGYKGTMPQKTIIELKDGIVGISEGAFREQNNLVGIKMSDSVTLICDKAFEKCRGLKEVKFSNSITKIGLFAFAYCRSLMDITIPDSVEKIESSAFYGTAHYNSCPDGIIYIDDWVIEYKGYIEENTNIEIKNGIKHIADGAFGFKINLVGIKFPDSLESIGEEAFFYCTALTEIIIPDNVDNIMSEAFFGCESLLSLRIGDNVKSIGEEAFYNCKYLSTVTIPDSVTEIGELAFGHYSSYNSYYGRYDDKSITYFTIYGKGNPTAQEYAKKNNLRYVILTGERKNQKVMIDKADYYITMDEPLTLYASATTTRTFVSLDRDVVEISRNGIVKTTGAGTATIIIGAKETKEYNFAFATMKVTVSKGTQEITNVREQYIKTANSSFTVHPMAKSRLTYTSSNKNVAVVSSMGEITVKKGGYAYITIKAIENRGYYSTEFRTKIISAPRNFTSKDVSKVKKISKTKAKITWKALAGASGYTVQYATNKSFKGAKTVKCSKKSAALTKLKKGKTYYVRINAYTKVSGKKYANKWYKRKFKM
ncbi:MAG: leucine-rich repeat protein [Ruminococcus sp.]